MSLFSYLRSKVAPGVYDALRELRRELRYSRIHRRGAARARREFPRHREPRRLQLACGPNHRSGWINIDLLHPDADCALDLRRPLPWPDNSIQCIYSEHFVEHLSYPGGLEPFLAECLRVLEPGGTFDAGVPDAEASLLAYARRDEAFFAEERRRWHPAWCVTPMDSVNYTFRQSTEHLYAYDAETLARRLTDAGFAKVQRRDWNPQSDTPGWETCLYVTAIKPEKA